ncbi:dolichol-phosphate mannosyltransferase [Paenibacillus sp. PastM-3]|uniref:glycosyltransferase family 2 protein n=1 Tax=unclassified Paenibacillus TaxID=185978 RepID=UPI002475F3FE|nr:MULTISPECIES: glycosyltransferase family 2 protein [unclassified Paenibacillus]MDH6481135.1 dolichol-phosphate mannosyltransferase [Paenibacillus sp. PastH-2]MDH6508556.1 dolichol-phosphate mannosyltransferase [Paenibacillus sp. PastM-3]
MVCLSVVVPVYNEERNIQELYLNVTEALREKVESYELVLVNDGSKDRSSLLLNELALLDPAVKVVHFKRNYGQTAAISAGIKHSQGELIALLDAGLQTDPRDIFRLMPFIGKIDFVNGRRTGRTGPRLKRIASRLENGICNWITGEAIADTGCPLKLFTREVADSLHLYNGMHRFLPALARMNGFSVVEVTVTHQKRKHGISLYIVLRKCFTGLMDAMLIGWLKKRGIMNHIKEGR